MRDGLRRSFWDLEAASHVGVDGAQEDAMDLHSLTCQKRPQGLRHAQRGRLRNGIAGRERQRGKRHQRQVVDDGSMGALEHGQERP